MFRKSKKYTHQQKAYRSKQDSMRKFRLMKTMFVLMFLAFALPSTVIAIDTQNEQDITFALGSGAGGATLAGGMTMAAIGDIDDVSDKHTVGENIVMEIKLVETTQVDNTAPWPYPNASREVSDIPMKAGEVPTTFYCHNTPKYLGSFELGDYTVDATKGLDFVLGDSYRDKVLNFYEEKPGAKFIVFFRRVEESQWYMMGTYDKPMRLKSGEIKNDDASVGVFKFANKSIRQFYKYTGSLQTAGATAIAADATELTVGSSDKYETANDNTAARILATVSGIAPADKGRTITIYGTGGADPHTIADNDVFILVDNETWTGNPGSRITFRIMDTGTLSEIDRVQT